MSASGPWIRASVRAVPPYTPGEQPSPGRRVVKLNTNENPYPPSEAVLRALHEAVDERVRLYELSGADRERWARLVDVLTGLPDRERLAIEVTERHLHPEGVGPRSPEIRVAI